MSIFPCFHFILASPHTPIWLFVLSTFLKQSFQRSPVCSICVIKSSSYLSYLSFLTYFHLLSVFAIVDYSVLKHTSFWLLSVWLFTLCPTKGYNLMCDSLSKPCTKTWTSIRPEERDFSIHLFVTDTFRVLNFMKQQYAYFFGSYLCFLCGFIIFYLAFKY